MRILEGHQASPSVLAYARDGRMLASGGGDDLVKLWDPLSGRELRTCLFSPGPVASLAFSSDGRALAAGRNAGTADIVETATGKLLRHHQHERDPSSNMPTIVAFSHDGQRLATAYRNQIIEWEGLTDRRLQMRSPAVSYHPHQIRSLAYSPLGRLAAGDWNIVSVWHDAHSSAAQTINWPEGTILALAFSAAEDLFAVARGRDVGLWYYDESHRGYRRRRVLRYGETVRAIAFTPDGQSLLVGGDDWTVHVHDVATGQKRTGFNWRLGPVHALAVAPDGMTAAVSGRDRTGILLWDLE
jgi:WD40 repeat protein